MGRYLTIQRVETGILDIGEVDVRVMHKSGKYDSIRSHRDFFPENSIFTPNCRMKEITSNCRKKVIYILQPD